MLSRRWRWWCSLSMASLSAPELVIPTSAHNHIAFTAVALLMHYGEASKTSRERDAQGLLSSDRADVKSHIFLPYVDMFLKCREPYFTSGNRQYWVTQKLPIYQYSMRKQRWIRNMNSATRMSEYHNLFIPLFFKLVLNTIWPKTSQHLAGSLNLSL